MVASGKAMVCVLVPVNCCCGADATVKVVVPPDVTVVAKASSTEFVWKFALESRRTNVLGVGKDVAATAPLASKTVQSPLPSQMMFPPAGMV